MASPYLLMERRWKVSKLTRPHWPDEVRLNMIEKSEFYSEPQIYQYGFYDGFQNAQPQTQELIEVIKELIPLAEDGYTHHKLNGCHQDFLEDDREILKKAKELLTKYQKP